LAEPFDLSAAELTTAVRDRRVSRREVLEAHLERIGTLDRTVGAFVERRDPDAVLAEADDADRRHDERATLRLDGVPLAVKDHFDVEGLRHTEAVVPFAHRRSPGTSVVVQRLVAAGAIVLGKTNQPDFQIRWNTVNALYPPTRNPRDTSLSAGGSSGGDAAAVASGMATLGLGADYGGSIRVPAAFCGVYGVRPSAGRVPHVQALDAAAGGMTLDLMNSPGPLARSLDDLWTALDVLAGAHPRDPVSVPVGFPDDSPRTVLRMSGETGAVIEPEIERELDRVCEALAGAGYSIVPGGIPHARRAPELWAELISAELLHSALPAWGNALSDSSRQHIETMFGLFDLGDSLSAWARAYAERRAVTQAVAAFMEEHPLIVAPVAGMPAPPLDFDHYLSVEKTRDLFDHMRDVVWVNLLSLPSVALPNGIQIVARRFHEAEAFAAAAHVPFDVVVAEPPDRERSLA
jgi:amidase